MRPHDLVPPPPPPPRLQTAFGADAHKVAAFNRRVLRAAIAGGVMAAIAYLVLVVVQS